MANYWKNVNSVIRGADILLIVLDARLVEDTRNIEAEDKVKEAGKPLIYVITKSDLVADKRQVEKYKKLLSPCVFISSKTYHGVTILKEKLLIQGKRLGKSRVTVGVLGYPNVGKSSLINAMGGRGAAPVSMMSGHTKGVQKVKCGGIMFLDTPGVIPYMEKSYAKHAMIGAIDFTKSKNPDLAVAKVMETFPGVLEKYYGVKINEDFEDTISEIAFKIKALKKGNLPDIDRASRAILKDWQNGKIVDHE